LYNRKEVYQRTLRVIFISQIFSGAGVGAGITVGALLVANMLGTESLSGLSTGLFTLGAAIAAFGVGRISQMLGRRMGLTAGFLTGAIGAFAVVCAALWSNMVLLFIALVIYGAGSATNLQARYAGTDLAEPRHRATAVSMTMVSTTLGAVVGPNLVGFMGEFARNIGIPSLAGPFLLAGSAYVLASFIIFVFLRPDPLQVSRELQHAINLDQAHPEADRPQVPKSSQLIDRRGIFVGAMMMVLTQVVMTAIMTMTPVHMLHMGHSLNAIGLIISIHIACMYLPSLFTGVLVDRLGRISMAIGSGVILLLAGLVAAIVPGGSFLGSMIALSLLGLGWNIGLITGTTMVIDATPIEIRAKTQGTIDVFVSLSGATGGVLSGIVMMHSSYAVLSFIGSCISLMFVSIVMWYLLNPARPGKSFKQTH
jgi:MFS family permease